MTHRKNKVMYDVDLKRMGDHGFRKLNAETGMEDIRKMVIPTESSLAARLGKIVNSKRGRKG